MSLFRPMEKRAVVTGGSSGSDFRDGSIPPPWWAGNQTAAGVSVDGDKALAIPAVWDCISLVSDYIAGLAVSLVRDVPGGGVETLGRPKLLERPHPELTWFEWMFQQQAALMLHGNAYGIKQDYDGLHYPRQIQPVDPATAAVKRVNGRLAYKFGKVEVPAEDVFHLRNVIMPGALVGLSPIEAHALTFGIQLAAEKFGAEFFGSSAHPTAVLQSDLPVDEKQANKISARVLAKLAGSRDPLVLGAGMKWTPIQVSPNESQFLETLKFGVNQTARVFKIPPELVGGSTDGGGSLTYNNAEGRDIVFQTYGIMPSTDRWVAGLSPLVPHQSSRLRFDLDARLRVDFLTRMQGNSIGVRSGIYCADEPRNKEGLEDIPDGLGRQFLWPPYSVKFESTEDNATVGDVPAVPAAPAIPAA